MGSSQYENSVARTVKLAGATGALVWDRRSGSTAHLARAGSGAVAVDAGGHSYVVGSVYDASRNATLMMILRLDDSGAPVWTRILTAPGVGRATRLDGQGGLVVAGEGGAASSSQETFRTLRLATGDGALAWDREIAGVTRAQAHAVAIDSLGHAVSAGYRMEPDGHVDLKVVRYGLASGSEAWQSSPLNIPYPQETWAHYAAVDAAGDVVLAGEYWGPTSILDDNEEILTAKLSAADARLQWASVYKGPLPDWPTAVAVDGAGNVMVGARSVAANGKADFLTMKHGGGDGSVTFAQRYNGPYNGEDEPSAMAVDHAGDVVIAGSSQGLASGSEWVVVKQGGTNGAPAWEHRPFPGRATGVAIDPANNAYAAGYRTSIVNGSFAYEGRLIKYGPGAAVLWDRSFSSSGLGSQVRIDPSGSVVLRGSDTLSKRSATDGSVTWERSIPGSLVEVDRTGHVVVDGIPAAVRKYSPAGDLLWERALPGATIYRLASDAAGNVFAAVRYQADMRLYKLASASGAVAWEFVKPVSSSLRSGPGAIALSEDAVFFVANSPDDSVRIYKISNLVADIFGDPSAFARQQYRDFLGREGDAAGVQHWANQLAAGAQDRARMVETFFGSAEFQGRGAPVVRLYFAYFLRIPDYNGLQFWMGQARGGASIEAVSNAFASSPEFVATYGALDNASFVDRVYRNVLDRSPDAPGLAFWRGRLDRGEVTRGQLMVAFSESAEYRSLIANEVYVTMMYAGMLRREPDATGLGFWVGYMDAGNSGLDLVRGFLASTEYRSRFGY